MCFSLLKFLLNVFKFIVGFNILHKKGYMCCSFYVYKCMYKNAINFDLNVFNDYNCSKIVIFNEIKIVYLIIM